MLNSKRKLIKYLLLSLLFVALLFIASWRPWVNSSWNDPYPYDTGKNNILYTAFFIPPKHLDPARSYAANEWIFISQIYEPPLQYEYFLRPYTLVPLASAKLPDLEFLDRNFTVLGDDKIDDYNNIAYTRYIINIKPDLYYQPHPAFVTQNRQLTAEVINKLGTLDDITATATRRVVAADYVYEIKRLADPKVQSPIFSVMERYIVGLSELNQQLLAAYNNNYAQDLELKDYQLSGVKVIDDNTYEILIKGSYPAFSYWLTMPFFAPVPWEAIEFYQQPGMQQQNISLDWYPIGSGPYMLTENNPEQHMVLEKNPNFHGEQFPATGNLPESGAAMPFVEKVVFSLEKESIPYWNKFLQGYYDLSGINDDVFSSVVNLSQQGEVTLNQALTTKGVQLSVSTMPSIFYWGFNMDDSVIGGLSEKTKKLRRAIRMAFDVEEYIDIFLNGRGIAANTPVPAIIMDLPEIKPLNKSLTTAKRLLAEAGYPNGVDSKTGEMLSIRFAAFATGDPNEKAQFAWLEKQFAKLGINLIIEATSYQRFQNKMTNGDMQMFFWGWSADYPDPENFLFAFYGPNGKVRYGGENAANYQNPQFDKLFKEFAHLPSQPHFATHRRELVTAMIEILQADSPWIFGFYPQLYKLSHQWLRTLPANAVANNTIKYIKLTPTIRAQLQADWNRPWLLPMLIVCLMLLAGLGFLYYRYQLSLTAIVRRFTER